MYFAFVILGSLVFLFWECFVYRKALASSETQLERSDERFSRGDLSKDAALQWFTEHFANGSNGWYRHLDHLTYIATLGSIFITALFLSLFSPDPDEPFLDQMLPRFIGVAAGAILAVINLGFVVYAGVYIHKKRMSAFETATQCGLPTLAKNDEYRQVVESVVGSIQSFASVIDEESQKLGSAASGLTACIEEIRKCTKKLTSTTKSTDNAVKEACTAMMKAVTDQVNFLTAGWEQTLERLADQNTAQQARTEEMLTRLATTLPNEFSRVCEESLAEFKERTGEITSTMGSWKDSLAKDTKRFNESLQLISATARTAADEQNDVFRNVTTHVADLLNDFSASIQKQNDRAGENLNEIVTSASANLQVMIQKLTDAVDTTSATANAQNEFSRQLPHDVKTTLDECMRSVQASTQQLTRQTNTNVDSIATTMDDRLNVLEQLVHASANGSSAASTKTGWVARFMRVFTRG